VRHVENASLIYFSGGDPAFLAQTLAGTPFWDAVMEAVERGAALAGCSAGACICGEVAPPTVTEAVPPEQWVQGLAGLAQVWVFPHWDALDRHHEGLRGFFLGSVPPHALVVGIDERTAMVTDDDETWRVFGSGTVTVRRADGGAVFQAGERFELHAAPPEVGPMGGYPLGRRSSPGRVRRDGLLSSDEFTPDVESFDIALLESTGSEGRDPPLRRSPDGPGAGRLGGAPLREARRRAARPRRAGAER
jgi:hypothetical protein